MNTLNLKEGQTYVCTKSKLKWWTVGKEYKVVSDIYGYPALSDNNGDLWWSHSLDACYTQFELRLDLNKLTKEQLRDYEKLIKEKEKAENHLNRFIEEMKE